MELENIILCKVSQAHEQRPVLMIEFVSSETRKHKTILPTLKTGKQLTLRRQ
jgi:hypothetical protein